MSANNDVALRVKEISVDSFLEIANRENVSGFAYLSAKMAYNIWAEYKDQKQILLVVGDKRQFISLDFNLRLAAEELQNYGVYLQTLDAVLEFRKYLIVIPEGLHEDQLAEYCKEYVDANLPVGKEPTYFVLEKPVTHLDQLSYWTGKMNEIFPGCASLNSYKALQEQEEQARYQANISSALSEAGIVKLDITELFNRKTTVSASASATRNTERLWPSIIELIQEVRDLYKERSASLPPNTRLFLTFSGKWDERKAYFCSYMFYEYSIPSYFENPSMLEAYTKGISELQFNFNKMLIEDQINYVKEFPDLSIVRAESNDFVAISLNRSIRQEMDWLSGKIRVKALEVISDTEISNVPIDMSLALTDISVYKLHNYFKSLNSDDVVQIRQEASVTGKDTQGRLLKTMLMLGDALRKEGHHEDVSVQYFLDLTKILMFEYDGKLYFSYVYNWDFTFQVLLKTIDPEQPTMIINVDRENLHRFLPFLSLPYKVPVILGAVQNVFNEFKDAITELNDKHVRDLSPKVQQLIGFLKMYSATITPIEVFARASFFQANRVPGGAAQSTRRRYKHDCGLGLLFQVFYSKEHYFIFSPGNLHSILNYGLTFKIVGLWCPKTLLVRQPALLSTLARNIKLTEHRKRYNFFSVFGGPLPMFEDITRNIADRVDLTEEFLKE